MSTLPAKLAAVGAATGAAAGAGGCAAGGGGAAPFTPVGSVRMRLPSPTLSPTLTLVSPTVPPPGEGTSIVAFADSSVTSASAALTLSPGLASTSITGTS